MRRVTATTDAPAATDADTDRRRSLRGRGLATTSTAAPLEALLDAGEARTRFAHLALRHGGGRRWLLVGLGARDEFDAERARVAAATVCGPRTRAGRALAVLGAAPPRRRRARRRARRGHAARRLPLRPLSLRARATTTRPRAERAGRVAAPRRRGGGRTRRRRWSPRRPNLARDLQNTPRQRPHADGAGRAGAGAGRRRRRRRSGRGADRAAAWAPSLRSRRARRGARADHRCATTRRRATARCSASWARP